MVAKLEDSGTTYFSNDHLGSSKLQTDDSGQIISTDVTQPFGPKLCDAVLKEDFATLDRVNTSKSRMTFDQVNGVILSPTSGLTQDNLLGNNSFVSVKSLEYQNVKILKFRLTADDTERSIKIMVSLTGKARVKVIGEDNKTYSTNEYTTNSKHTCAFYVNLVSAPNQLYLVTLELAGNGTVTTATNNNFEAVWTNPGKRLGEVWTTPYTLAQDARAVRLNWIGTGVGFQVSTDTGKTWETVNNGEVTKLRNPGRTLLLKALLQVSSTTVLDSYSVEINPIQYMLFTGKELDEDIGLVYFGARWYDPEVGRFVSVDPAEDGENWYGYCGGNPVNYVDPDGQRIWFIHGTATTNETWAQDYPQVVNRIRIFFGDTINTNFNWPPPNNDDDTRRRAALRLEAEIRNWHNLHRSQPIRLVCHSHGGNVAILAANLLGDPRRGEIIQIDNLITVSTPVREYQLQSNNVRLHNNVYNTKDEVQINGGSNGVATPWYSKPFIPKGANNQPGEYGEADRVFPRTFAGVNNIRVNLPRNLPGSPDGLVAHGYILKNVNLWIRQVELRLRR